MSYFPDERIDFSVIPTRTPAVHMPLLSHQQSIYSRHNGKRGSYRTTRSRETIRLCDTDNSVGFGNSVANY